ncbi:MAG: Npt1/Npt2 family nucleotide transporter [Actinomycetota bacterium]
MNASRVQRLVALKPGEGRPVGLIVAISFFVSAGLMIGQSGIEALFFDRYGVERLPVMYLVLGGTMFLATLGFGWLLARLGRGRACIVIPVSVAALAMAGRLALAADVAWITQALWLLQGVGYFVLGLTVWGLAGIVTDTRQAKRFFPLIGAGGVLGYVIGGLVTKPLAAWLGTPNLLLVWVGTLAIAVGLSSVLLARAKRLGVRTSADLAADATGQLTVGLRYVARSTLMRWLALGSILFSLLFFSLYLPFSRAATEQFPSPDDLAGFFGLFFGLSTGVAFVLSLFVTNRLLARFGVPTVLLVLPLLYVVAFGVLAVDDGFAALMIFRFAQVAWLQGGASSSTEAVINTVPPDRRDQTRAFIYGGPTQVGTILAGVIALIGERALSPGMLYLVGLAAAVLATVAMIGVRRAYSRELVQALREGRPSVFGAGQSGSVPFEPFGLARADASALGVAVGALGDPDARVRRVAATVLGDLDAPAARHALVEALGDDDDDVRADAVRSLARSGATDAVADIMQRTVDRAPAVRLATAHALRALGVQAEAASHAVGPLMHDRDPFVRVSAAAALAALDDHPAAGTTLVELAGSDDDDVRTAAFREMRGIGLKVAIDVVLAGMHDEAPSVRAAAAHVCAELAPTATEADDDRALDALVAAACDRHLIVREAASDGLVAIGEPAVDPLVRSLDSPDRRAGALAALERLPVDGRAQDLRSFAATTVQGAVERHRLGAALEDDAEEAVRLLKDTLHFLSERDALLGLRAAALVGGGAEMRVALENLSVSDPGQRANALEVIESVGERDIVRPLLTMWEGTPAGLEAPAVMQRLEHDPDDWIRACAALAARSRGGTMTETLPTLSMMERVLFLRKVPLFAALPPPDLEPIASIAREQAFAEGDTIAEQGETGDEMFIIVSGTVSVTSGRGDGRRVLATRSPGDVVGEMAVITNEPRIAGLECDGPVRVLSIDRRRFESILRERPETSLGVIRVLCQRLTESGDHAGGADGTGTTTASTG